MAQSRLGGIVVYRAAEGLLGTGCLDCLDQCLGHVESLAGAAGEVDFHLCQVDAGQKSLHVGGVFYLESQRGHALGEHVERDGVGSGSIGGDDVLAGEPVVGVADTADVGELARQRISGSQAGDVLGTVDRLHVEALVGAPDQFLVKVGALEVGHDFVAPFLVGHARKLFKQFFGLFSHNLVVIYEL